MDSCTFCFWPFSKGDIKYVVLRRRPPEFRLCNLYAVRLLNSKVELEVAPFAWLHSSFARGQIHLGQEERECQGADYQTEKLRCDPCAPPCCHRSCATANYQNRQPVGILGIRLAVSGSESSSWRTLSEWTRWKLPESMTTCPRQDLMMKRSRMAGVILTTPRSSSSGHLS